MCDGPAPRLRPPFWDSQQARPAWLCPLCGAEQYDSDSPRQFRGRLVCAVCLARLEKEEGEDQI